MLDNISKRKKNTANLKIFRCALTHTTEISTSQVELFNLFKPKSLLRSVYRHETWHMSEQLKHIELNDYIEESVNTQSHR